MSGPLLRRRFLLTQPNWSTTGRKYTVTVKDFRVLQCQRCQVIVFDEAANETLSNALRVEAGLLRPEEIHANREKLGLTQKQLAGFLRISESTLSRWETVFSNPAAGYG